MNGPVCMHCQQPFQAHTRRGDDDPLCPDGKNTFNFEFQISPEAAAYVQANMDKSPNELAQGWIEQVRQRERAAREALQHDGAKVLAKAARGEPLTLFDALESIGATMDEMWQGEWTGPILFNDSKGHSRLILVEDEDHDLFAEWLRTNALNSPEMQQLREAFKDLTDPFVNGLQEHARQALGRMCARPVSATGG